METMLALAGAVAAVVLVGGRRHLPGKAGRVAHPAAGGSSGDAIIFADSEGRITSWDPGAESTFGWRRAEVLGESVEKIVALSERHRVTEALKQLFRGPHSWHIDGKALRQDGTIIDVALTISPVLEGPKPVGMVIIGVDTTERRRTEAALREHERQLDEVQRLARLGSWSWDVRADTLEWSDELFRGFGLAPGELQASFAGFLELVHHEDRTVVEEAVRRSLEEGEPYSLDFRAVRPDGAVRWFHARGSVERDELGAPLSMVGTAQDITETVELISESVTARDAALEASRAKSDFLAMMSHEIRTPMNAVIGLTELLLDGSLAEDQRQFAEGVNTAGHALLALINDILDFSKIEAGHLEMDLADFDVGNVLEEVCDLVAQPARAKGLELISFCAPEVNLARRGDGSRLRQVLLNLASNAVKFTEHGEVVIRVRAAAGGQLRFEVADTGIGIAPEDCERLFDPFVQADSSTTRRYGGTGLGLSISRRLVEAMGGRIEVASTPGQGSTFWFTLPMAAASAPTTRHPEPTLEGARALVVDDNATNRTILERQLTALGLSVELVSDGPTALGRLREAASSGRPHDVVVVDVVMPGMTGIEVAAAIASDATFGSPGVLLLTSGSGLDGGASQLNAAAWLAKPVRRSDLRTGLLKAVGSTVPVPWSAGVTASSAPKGECRGKILVAEDDELNWRVIRGMLARLGYEAQLAVDGAEAVATATAGRYDAVLMDCHMPHLDGFEATRRIRAAEADGHPRLPIIALTAGARAEDRDRCLAAGMDEYLSKPIRRGQLEATLQRFVSLAEAAAPNNCLVRN